MGLNWWGSLRNVIVISESPVFMVFPRKCIFSLLLVQTLSLPPEFSNSPFCLIPCSSCNRKMESLLCTLGYWAQVGGKVVHRSIQMLLLWLLFYVPAWSPTLFTSTGVCWWIIQWDFVLFPVAWSVINMSSLGRNYLAEWSHWNCSSYALSILSSWSW